MSVGNFLERQASQLRALGDDSQTCSLSARMRARRFAIFAQLAERLPSPLHILDIGGTTEFWERAGWAERDDRRITVLNHVPQPQRHENVPTVVGDACDLGEFADHSWDVVFSNSVIEHLFTYDKQVAMASEVRRVAKAYWVQTPNYWFPIEPHFRFIGWQWLPLSVRIAIIRRRRCGYRGPTPDPAQARETVSEVRLLSRRELARLFPEATIRAERLLGLTKSWIAIHGFPG